MSKYYQWYYLLFLYLKLLIYSLQSIYVDLTIINYIRVENILNYFGIVFIKKCFLG